MRNYLRIGQIISLHGIRGEIKIFPTTDNIKRFDDLKIFYIVDSVDASDEDFKNQITYEKETVKYIKNTVVLKIKGIDSIESASKFIKKNLYVDRENSIELSKNEHFVVDLIGLPVFKNEMQFGKVINVMKTKANDILVIDYNNKEILVPLVDDFIETIDEIHGKIKIRNIEGLI